MQKKKKNHPKSCFSVEKLILNQQTACGAPVCWSKYTTVYDLFFLKHVPWTARKNNKCLPQTK